MGYNKLTSRQAHYALMLFMYPSAALTGPPVSLTLVTASRLTPGVARRRSTTEALPFLAAAYRGVLPACRGGGTGEGQRGEMQGGGGTGQEEAGARRQAQGAAGGALWTAGALVRPPSTGSNPRGLSPIALPVDTQLRKRHSWDGMRKTRHNRAQLGKVNERTDALNKSPPGATC